MDEHLFQSITVAADTLLFLFVGVYFFKLHKKEKELEKSQQKVDTEYHRIVDDALSKERKILEDAVQESEKIIEETKFVSRESKHHLDQSLDKMVIDMQQNALNTAKQFSQSYQTGLQQLAHHSLSDFQRVSASMESELQKEIKQFQTSLLPAMQKELDTYKESRMKEIEQQVNTIVQKVAQQTLNKSIPLADHNQLIIDALEKAKNQGAFDDYAAKTAPQPSETEEQKQEKVLADEIRAQSPGITKALDYGHPQPN